MLCYNLSFTFLKLTLNGLRRLTWSTHRTRRSVISSGGACQIQEETINTRGCPYETNHRQLDRFQTHHQWYELCIHHIKNKKCRVKIANRYYQRLWASPQSWFGTEPTQINTQYLKFKICCSIGSFQEFAHQCCLPIPVKHFPIPEVDKPSG